MRNSQAFEFLKSLHQALDRRLPTPENIRIQVRELVAASAKDDTAKHKRQPEDAFLNHFALPIVSSHLQTYLGLTAAEARTALLSEYFRNMREICSGTPARKQRHPFDKQLKVSPHAVMKQWSGESGATLRQSCPDFALRAPCTFPTVFEGKYFERGGKVKAEADLVTNVYQAFFYRALPKIEQTPTDVGWPYEFACLLAYDASPDGSLQAAWNRLDKNVKSGFWEGANVYVMVVRGEA